MANRTPRRRPPWNRGLRAGAKLRLLRWWWPLRMRNGLNWCCGRPARTRGGPRRGRRRDFEPGREPRGGVGRAKG
eukprot:4784200-Lingulodinium_polyedra.AAC.1